MPSANEGPRSLWRALRNRNYRLFFGGQTVSLIGTWLTRVATSWLVYRLTQSALLLGVVSFAGQIPTFLLSPIAGVLVDRWNKHRVLLFSQIVSMIQSALLALFAFTGWINIWHLLWLSMLQGLVNAFDTPSRQSFVVEMLDDKRDLPNAIALNSSMVNIARLLGPSVAGVLIAGFGEAWCFTIDAASYLAVIGSLLAMRLAEPPPARQHAHLGRALLDGLRYVAGFAPIRATLLLLALVSVAGMPYMVLMPVMATRVFHGGAHTLGFLMAASGLGALAGALYLAQRRSVTGLGRVIVVAAVLFGLGLIGFSRSGSLPLALLLLLVAGAGMMVLMAASNTVLQTIVDDDKRGRVMSFFAMAFFGSVPVGSLIGGALADRVGVPATIGYGGVACILGGLLYLRELPALQRLGR